MNWGKSIVVAFVLFAVFIGTLVYVCVREDISLVTKDYYQEELAYEDQIVRLRNTEALVQKPVIRADTRGVAIEFASLPRIQQGELFLFCPSDSRNDLKFKINPSESTVRIILIKDFKPGMYHAKFSWSMEGKEFYLDKIITL